MPGGKTLAERLTDSEFQAIPSLGSEPHVVRFQPSRFGSVFLGPVYAEFLAPLVGSDVDRDGSTKDVLQVQAGLTAQALRYLDLLFVEKVSFDAGSVRELRIDEPISIYLPNPASYVIQKLLAWPSRAPGKRSKDFTYIHEVAVLTQKQWQGIADIVVRLKQDFPIAWFERARALVKREFHSAHSEGPVLVARQYRDVSISAPGEKSVWRTVNEFAETTGII